MTKTDTAEVEEIGAGDVEAFPEQEPAEALATAQQYGTVRSVTVGDEVVTLDHLEESANLPVQIEQERLVGQPFVIEELWSQPKNEGELKLYDMVLVAGRLAEADEAGKVGRVGARRFLFIAGRLNQASGEAPQVLASELEPILLEPVDPTTGEQRLPLYCPRGLTQHPGQQGGSYFTIRRPREANAEIDLWGDA